jgi:Zn-dependent metalloprotease
VSFGTGGVDDAEDGEVVIHEYGHSVQDNQVPGFGATVEGGSMGEGFGDYLAGTVNASLAGDFQLTCIAEWDATSYAAGVPHCLRRLDSTKHFPEDRVGEVHADGEMWSASLFQIRTALGAAKADTLILQAHFLLTSRANFADGSNALVTAAQNLGFTATEVNTVRTILQSRGFSVTA